MLLPKQAPVSCPCVSLLVVTHSRTVFTPVRILVEVAGLWDVSRPKVEIGYGRKRLAEAPSGVRAGVT